MKYQSTRSAVSASSINAVLEGIAPDGGLYIMPNMADIEFDWQGCLKKSSLGMAEQILSALLPDVQNMGELVRRAYEGKFETDELTPLVRLGEDYVLELFRGPTSAFKDVALSMLPQLITAGRRQLGVKEETVILTATSGDTGKAALEGFHDVEGTRIIVFYPDGGVSPVQRSQMVTQSGKNVKVCAVKGNFDDCQRGVKECFAELNASGCLEGRGLRLSSANSINIGRLAPQVVYYFIAYAKLLELGDIALGERVDFVVPTGNFGDILAGYFAKLLGLPVGRLVCASNSNRVLTDFLRTGVYDRRREFYKTSSPSMDILVSSNLERLLYLASGGDTEKVAALMKELSEKGVYRVDDKLLSNIKRDFAAFCCDETQTAETIARLWRQEHYLADPHTAVAAFAAEKYKAERGYAVKTVILSTASPFKFPAAVLSAIGGDCSGDEFEQMERLGAVSGLPVPKNLSGLREREELHSDLIERGELTDYVKRQLGVL